MLHTFFFFYFCVLEFGVMSFPMHDFSRGNSRMRLLIRTTAEC